MPTPAALIYSEQVALIVAALAGIIQVALSWYACPSGRTNDGQRYKMMAAGQRMPAPFAIRFLLPRLLGPNPWVWFAAQGIALPILCVLTALLSLREFEATPSQAALAGAMMAFMPITRILLDYMISPDLVGMLLFVIMLLSPEPYALALAMVAWTVRETAPVYAALWHLNPSLAIPALLGAGIIKYRNRKVEDPLRRESTTKPFYVGRRTHASTYHLAVAMILPWGLGLLATLRFAEEPLVFFVFLAGYAPLLLATDHIRLYQFIAPLVVALAATTVPEVLILPAAIVHFFWPYPKEYR